MLELPECKPLPGLADAFGHRARSLRDLQWKLLDLLHQHDYQEVIPPMLERPESLQLGAGHFLSDQTLVLSDPAGAGLMALRPDITPQIARIAATRLCDQDILRLCYSGQVILARPDTCTGSRQQWQTGVELLGIPSLDADIEVIQLAALSMHHAGFDQPVIQIGHMQLLQSLIQNSQTSISTENWLRLLNRRSPEDMQEALVQTKLSSLQQQALLEMASGQADLAWVKHYENQFDEAFQHAASDLQKLIQTIEPTLPQGLSIQPDAAVTPRFLYHTGMVFSGYAQGSSQALLHGGRYDAMMKKHGRDMPATGFSFDLWRWLNAIIKEKS
ncbi:MAG: ATP phosphoribosyltransferase regulatory subunit [Mariprofundaceae bacterium]|nr:ATP phosphoribosyltransferase regulatory subunit [Mariprofundaceae bacterium]